MHASCLAGAAGMIDWAPNKNGWVTLTRYGKAWQQRALVSNVGNACLNFRSNLFPPFLFTLEPILDLLLGKLGYKCQLFPLFLQYVRVLTSKKDNDKIINDR